MKDKFPTISILICAYNAIKTIERCIDSAINQINYDSNKIKIYILNDGSKDKTSDVLKKYKLIFPNKIFIVSQNNQGVAMSRNNIIKEVNTDFFIFLDCDDYLHKECIFNLYKASNKGKCDIIVAKAFYVIKKYKITWFLTKFIKTKMTPLEYISNNVPSVWNALIKTSFFKHLNFKWQKGLDFAEDTLFGNFVIPQAKNIGTCLKHTYCYVKNKNSMTDISHERYKNVQPFINQFKYFLELMKRDKQKFNKIDTNHIINQFAFELLIYIIYCYRINFVSKDFLKVKNQISNIFITNKIKILKPKIYWKKVAYQCVIKKIFSQFT